MKTAATSLTVALDKNTEASGYLYFDDGETQKYKDGEYSSVEYKCKGEKLSSKILNDKYKEAVGNYDKIIFLGVQKKPRGVRFELPKKKIAVNIQNPEYNEETQTLTIDLSAKRASVLDEFVLHLDFYKSA